MSPEQELSRAQDAKHLLEHPLLVEARQEIERRLVEQLSAAEIAPERVGRLQALLAAHRLYHRYLEVIVTSGTKAAFDIDERKRSWFDKIIP